MSWIIISEANPPAKVALTPFPRVPAQMSDLRLFLLADKINSTN